MQRAIRYSWIILSLTVFIYGCGGGGSDAPDLGQVSGTITIDGKPAKNVNIVFQPEKGRPAVATTDSEGNYEMLYNGEPGAVIGKNLVTINTPEPAAEGCCGQASGDGCGGCGESTFLDPIPPMYNSAAANNPEMTKEVKSGSQEFNFEIKSDPGARTGDGCGSSRSSNLCCG